MNTYANANIDLDNYPNTYTNTNTNINTNMDISDKIYLGLCSFIIIGLLFSASINRL